MDVSGHVEICGVRVSFKFQLGEIVVRRPVAEQENLHPQPSKVVAIQLGGYIQVQPIGTLRKLLVNSNDYERFEEETLEFHYQDNEIPPRR